MKRTNEEILANQQQPDPNIPIVDEPDVLIYWLNGDNPEFLSTAQATALDETYFCSPAIAVVTREVLFCEAFTLIENKINYLRKLGLEREAANTWMIPSDCPVGDEKFLPVYLPWTVEELEEDPGVLQRPFPQEHKVLYPYGIMPLVVDEGDKGWLVEFNLHCRDYSRWLGSRATSRILPGFG